MKCVDKISLKERIYCARWQRAGTVSIEQYANSLNSFPQVPRIAAAVNNSNHVTLYDTRSAGATQQLRGHGSDVRTVTWSPTVAYLLVSGV